MKKFIGGIVGVLLLVEIALFVSAKIESSCPPEMMEELCYLQKRPLFASKISLMLQTSFFGAIVIAFILLTSGSVQWIKSKGNKTKSKSAKKEVIAGAILSTFLMFAYYIVQLIAAHSGPPISHL